ncbi:MAG: DUF1972 domain-containing protein [Bacteroidales bacterium]|nr:DUF1972 domain-containing protein [Bacteroidales bacterium]
MKIGILGTRGIPNRYGGFEQWAETLSQGLVQRGCGVIVYNSHFHPYRKKDFNGVGIIHKWDPKGIGLTSQFVYDLLCVLSARRQNFDAIIQLGYTTSSVWAWLLPKKTRILYNMDGMEWKREKYKGVLKSFLKYAEKLAVRHSDVIIADSKPIKQYIEKKYGKKVEYIAYSVETFDKPDSAVLKKYDLEKYRYNLLIARFQPDNNLETIIQGALNSTSAYPLLIVGDYKNRYGKYLRRNYRGKSIIFSGRNFEKKELDNLRYFSNLYFHGHSAGGTNPSLLEAMAASCVICAHRNEFNQAVLGDNAWYFENANDISKLLETEAGKKPKTDWIENNLITLRNEYNVDVIIDKYRKLF